MTLVCAALLGLLAASCNDEPCFYSPTSVVLQPVAQDGGVSPMIDLVAIANGLSCGCCGGRPPTTIVSYAWDLDGDGVIDRSGATLSEVEVAPSTTPTNVSVTVTDSQGTTASASVTLPAR